MRRQDIETWQARMRARGLEATTIERRIQCVRELGDRPFDLTAGDIEDILDARAGRYGQGLSPRTRRHWISHLHAFYEWAIIEGLTDHDPTLRVGKPKVPELLPRPIPTDELQRAIDLADPQMRTWLLLGALAGLRCMEIADLTADRVLWAEGMLRVLGKGRKERLVPLHEQAAAGLRRWHRQGPVFRRPSDGRAYTRERISQLINEHLHDTAGSASTAHSLRHWFGTQVYQSTRDIRLTQYLLGHSSPVTTAGYSQFRHDTAAAAVAGLSIAA